MTSCGIRIGRVIVNVGALPAVFPVNFPLLDDDVVFPDRTGYEVLGGAR